MPKQKPRKSIKSYKLLCSIWDSLLELCPEEYKNITLSLGIQDDYDYELTKGGVSTHGSVVIGYKFAEKFKDNSVILATMLAHELAHHILGHMHNYHGNKSHEQDCDMLSMFLVNKLGHCHTSILDGTKVYEKWRYRGIQKSHQESHGTAKERIMVLDNQKKYLEDL